jgi:predicted negative regulator of RcsB-dependent stress response
MKKKPNKTPVHRRRMSSRELREKMSHDPLMDSINWVRTTWINHGNKILFGLIAFFVVLFGVRFYQNQKQSRMENASMMFDVAYEDYTQSLDMEGDERVNQENEALSSVDQLVVSFPGSTRAVHGLLLKGDILYRQGNYEEALEAYESAASQANQEDSVVLARMGIAQCRADLEDAAAGIEVLQAILVRYPDTNFADQIHLQMARLYEAEGNGEQALTQYEKIDEDSPFLTPQIKQRIEFLKAPVVSFGEPSA